MRIGIDATNIGGGGGVTHLKEILHNFNKEHFEQKVTAIIVFSSNMVLDQLNNDFFIQKISFPELNTGLISRIRFQLFNYDKEIKKRCDILYSITGDYTGSFRPIISMSRNMLLYERDIWYEIKSPKEIIRFWLNFKKQEKCFKNSTGIIFISKYAKNYIQDHLPIKEKEKIIIYHGISPRFISQARKQKKIRDYSFHEPFKFLYISTVHIYKNQWNVVNAIANLRKKGFPVVLTLVGGVIFKPAGKKLFKTIDEVDPKKEFIFFEGNVEYDQIENYYKKTDGIIYASSCENMPNILIESMASGFPIACSDKEPMPEFLKNGGFYFDSKSVRSIEKALLKLMNNNIKRKKMVINNIKEVKKYSWAKTSKETFDFITKLKIVNKNHA